MILVDANIILRFLLNDDPLLHQEAKLIFLKASQDNQQIYIDNTVIAEVVWVLKSFYKLDKASILTQLKNFCSQPFMTGDQKPIILKALKLYSHYNLSYIDCYLLALSQKKRLTLKTQDESLMKISSQLNRA